MPDKKQVKSFVGKSSFKHPAALSEAQGVKELRVAAPAMHQENEGIFFFKKERKKSERKQNRKFVRTILTADWIKKLP